MMPDGVSGKNSVLLNFFPYRFLVLHIYIYCCLRVCLYLCVGDVRWNKYRILNEIMLIDTHVL